MASVASTVIGCVRAFETNLPRTLTSLPHLYPPPRLSTPAFSALPAGGSGYNITTGAYGYGGGDGPYGSGAYGYGYGVGFCSGGAYGYGGNDGGYGDGAYSGGPYDHGGHGGASYEAVPVRQSPGGGGAGHDIPSRPPGAPNGGYHRAMQQAGNGGDGVAFAAEDGGHEDEGYFGGPLSSVFGGPESGHDPTAYVLQLSTSGRSGGTGCNILRSLPQYSGSNNGYDTNGGPQ